MKAPEGGRVFPSPVKPLKTLDRIRHVQVPYLKNLMKRRVGP